MEKFFHTRLHALLTLTTTPNTTCEKTIRKCTPDFFPLFVGIIFSISKGKYSWNKFIDSVLDYTTRFLTETNYSTKNNLHISSKSQLSIYRNLLYLYFSPLLWELNTRITTTLTDTITIGKINLYEMKKNLLGAYFLTKSGQDFFYTTLIKQWDKLYFPNVDELFKSNDEIKNEIIEFKKNRLASNSGKIPFIDPSTYCITLFFQIRELEVQALESRKSTRP